MSSSRINEEVEIPEHWNSNFAEDRSDGKFVDGHLRSNDGALFPIHKLLLAKYLRNERWFDLQTMETFDVPVSGETLKQILDYVYDGTITINHHNLERLIQGSHHLRIAKLFVKCCQFVESNLDCANAVRFRQIVEKFEECDQLRDKIDFFVLANFSEMVLKSEEFLDLPLHDFRRYLDSDALNVSREEDVFEVINQYINRDPNNRSHSMSLLLKTVRLALCDHEFLTRIAVSNSNLKTSAECYNLVMDAVEYQHAKENRQDEYVCATIPFARPRMPHHVIFAIGGWSNGGATSIVECYDIRTNRWFPTHCGDNTPRAYHGMAILNNLIYIVGGFDGTDCLNSVRTFDPVSRRWSEVGCMYDERCYVSVVEMNGIIYAMGGFDGHNRLNSCERFDPNTNQWSLIASMHRARSDASAVVLRNKIYMVGGFTGRHVLRSAEFYDPATDQWTYIGNITTPRSGHCLVVYRDRIFALGGFDGNTRLKKVEKYDATLDSWTAVTNMITQRSNFASTVLEDKIFAIGGFRGNTTIQLVETYSADDDRWTESGSLITNRSALNCGVMKGLTTVTKEFTFLGNAQ